MKKLLCTLHFALCIFCTASAQTPAQTTLHRLAANFKAMGGYCVDFEVQTREGTLKGYYEVSGDTYYMRVGDAEVFGDAHTRYEVSPTNREIVIDGVDLSSRNLLNNPTRAFDFVGEEYASSVLRETNGRTTIRLKPTAARSAVETIDVEVDTARHTPVSVVYHIDGDALRIDIRSVSPRHTAPTTFDKTRYPGYEWIDFR